MSYPALHTGLMRFNSFGVRETFIRRTFKPSKAFFPVKQPHQQPITNNKKPITKFNPIPPSQMTAARPFASFGT